MKDKCVIVTGGASGLGYGIAERLLNAGARVAIVDKDEGKLAALGSGFERHAVDVTDEMAVRTAVDAIVAKWGTINALVNSAGLIYSEPLINLLRPAGMRHSYATFKQIIDLDLNSVFLVTSIVVEKMVARRAKGAIVNISSIAARGNAGQSAYSAAKAGVEALTKVWAKELGVLGIRCNAIAPGFIDTPSTAAAISAKFVEHVKANTPLRRLGDVESVARAAQFAIEDEFLNGAVIDINGGLSI